MKKYTFTAQKVLDYVMSKNLWARSNKVLNIPRSETVHLIPV